MKPLSYHSGQRAIQDEANTRRLADNLAHWNGPVAEFALEADLVLLAAPGRGEALRFSASSGPAPLVEVAGPSAIRFDPSAGPLDVGAGPVGGLAINLGTARRVRLNGTLAIVDAAPVLDLEETFTLCRKYMAPSITLGDAPHAGPLSRIPVARTDEALAATVSGAETAFLASATPSGAPDVAHRGGPAGFIEYDPGAATVTWPEYLGDGIFKSAGNVRATGRFTLLLPDFTSGAAYELVCEGATYENLRGSRHERVDALIQDRSPYPVQGVMRAHVISADRLAAFTYPRQRIESARRVTSRDAAHTQAPQ